MYRISILLLALLAVACSEYEVKSTEEISGAPDGEAVEDTATPISDEEDPGESPGDDSAITETPDEDPTDSGEPCSEVVTAFDIEEVSALQDAASPHLVDMMTASMYTPWYRDALMIDYVLPESGPAESWRISAVYVLVMIPTSRFDSFPDGELISVEVFDGPDPRTTTAWKVTASVNRSELMWADYTLPADAAISGHFAEFSQRGAWLRFDMTSVIPESGMTSPTFVTGIQWEVLSPVAVGYSNFNRACNRNWTEWSPGSGWRLNGDASTTAHCSWPMLRVEVEHTYTEDC